MKFLRSSFLFLFLFLTLFCFAASPYNDSLVYSTDNILVCYLYTYTSPSQPTSSTFNNIKDLDALSVVYKNVPFGVCVRTSDAWISAPSDTSRSNSSYNVNYQIKVYSYNASSNLVSNYYSPRSFSTIAPLYTFASLLFRSGYSGPAIDVVGVSGQYTYFNFDYRLAISDILSSTNSVYRSLVLSHLNSISSSVNNIDYGVSTISSALIPSLNHLEEINSNISSTLSPLSESVDSIHSYVSDINEALNGTQGTLTDISTSVSSIPSYLHSNSNALERLHNDNALSNLDVFLGDDTSSWIGFLNWAKDNQYISQSELEYFTIEFQETDPSNPPSRSFSIPSAHRRFLAKSSLQGRVVAANKIQGLFLSTGNAFDDSMDRTSSALRSLGNWFNQGTHTRLSSLEGVAITWRDRLHQQLQDWKTSDEHGILNVKNKIGDVDSSIKKNFEVTAPFGPGNPLGTNTIPFTAFTTNFVVVPLTNSVDDAAVRIVTNDSVEAQATRDFLNDNLFSPEAEGAAVRIKYPIYGEHQRAVHVHDEALDVFGSGIDELNYNVDAILGDMNSQWEKWFRLWGDWSPSVSSNIEEILDVLLHWTNNTAQLNHVLFQDYSNYVYSASYDDLFSTLESDYPVCYSNLVKFGLSSSEDGGRWWNVLSSSVAYDTAMISYVFSDMVELDRIARDNLGESPFSFLQRTLSDMPSKTQIEDYVSQASNATFQITGSLASLSNSLNSVSNSYASVFNPFRGHFDSPGSSVTFFKIHDGRDGQYVTIPVGDQADAWRYIRLGVSFGLVAVNILLFPKYLLMLFTLFIKAYRIGINFFPDDR